MDRAFRIVTGKQQLIVEAFFHYDDPREVRVDYTLHRPYDFEDSDEGSSYQIRQDTITVPLRRFESIAQIKAYDQEFARQYFGDELTDPRGYTFEYDPYPLLQRYIVGNDRRWRGIVDVVYRFENNTKEVRFRNNYDPKWDELLVSNSLETNVECIVRLPVIDERREENPIRPDELRRLPTYPEFPKPEPGQ